MKKNLIYIVVLILACALTGTITYIVLDSKEDNKTNENNNQNNNSENNDKVDETNQDNEESNNNNEVVLKDGVELISVKEENDKIIEEFKVVLNGKEQILKVEFNYEYSEEQSFQGIYGEFNDIIFVSRGYYNTQNIFNINNIKDYFNEDNFQIIKGTDDKNYLLIMSNEDERNILYVFNDELELLTKNLTNVYLAGYYDGFVITNWIYSVTAVENKENPGYEDTFNLDKNYETATIYVKIENNKIYYLVTILDDANSWNDGYLEERVYTINNDKLEYEVINTYKITEISNMI